MVIPILKSPLEALRAHNWPKFAWVPHAALVGSLRSGLRSLARRLNCKGSPIRIAASTLRSDADGLLDLGPYTPTVVAMGRWLGGSRIRCGLSPIKDPPIRCGLSDDQGLSDPMRALGGGCSGWRSGVVLAAPYDADEYSQLTRAHTHTHTQTHTEQNLGSCTHACPRGLTRPCPGCR